MRWDRLANLHGDIIATAALAEKETKLLSTSDSTEYGVPTTSTPAKYAWLGAEERPTELPSGVINMGARAYIPQLGRFEQTDPQPGGSINAYAYTDDDPVNEADPSGEFTTSVSYDYEAAQTGQAQSGLPEDYTGPGAISPPPVNMQLEEEFVAHPPWLAATVFSEGQGIGEGGYSGGGDLGLFIRLYETGLIGEVGHWIDEHVVKPVEHFVHEIATNLPKCYSNEIEGGGQCSSAPPGEPEDPFYPIF